jgi:mannose-6-phosphate isomerase-like protein (cupin superfamily)
MTEPIIANVGGSGADSTRRFSAVGRSFVVHEWRGSGPAALHIHHADDEAWHVLDGTLRFRFIDRVVDVGSGGTVFVPAGVAHAYEALGARYLIILTPRLAALIAELQQTADRSQHAAVYQKYESELLDA